MSQAGGGSLAKGLIEITGNVAPLEASLKQAEGSVQASLNRMQAQVGGGAGAGPGRSGGNAAGDMAASAAAAGRLNDQLGVQAQKAAQAKTGLAGLTASISGATAGFRGIVGAVQSTIGAITAALGWIGLITTAITFLIDKMKERGRLEAEGRQDLLRLAKEGADLDKQALIDRSTGIEREIKQLDQAYEKRIDDINRIYTAEVEAAKKLEEEKQSAELKQAEMRARARAFAAQDQYRTELKAINKSFEDQVRATERAEAQKNREIEKNLMGPRERMIAEYEDKKAAIEEAMRKNAGNRDAIRTTELHRQRLDLLKQELDQSLADIDAKAQAEADANAKVAAEAAKRASEQAAALVEAQRTAVQGLRGEINSLFNTNQLEVGITRVAQLMQVLIAKTGKER